MIKEIQIRPALNGYVCRVGCQEVVFNDRQVLLLSLREYLDQPEEVEARFLNLALNKMPPVTIPQNPERFDPHRAMQAEACQRLIERALPARTETLR